jgi:glycosyltransferase involved in cell wall biosynthesis
MSPTYYHGWYPAINDRRGPSRITLKLFNPMTTSKKPLISCLCVSKRQSQLKNAIESFSQQTYPNKELIVVVNRNDKKCVDYLKKVSVKNVRYFIGGDSDKVSLGELRNISVEKSKGEYFCQWDDDDWYHNKRLEVQMDEALKNNKAGSVLAYWLMFDSLHKKAYMSFPHIWAGTILCERSVFSDSMRYPDQPTGEDTAFLRQLYMKNCLYPIVMPALYVYVFHGANTMPPTHFSAFFSQSQVLSKKTSSLIGSIVDGKYSAAKASELITSSPVVKEFDYFVAWK